ncbi:SPOSA6832_03348, partial [Sporobolomyces salmonicolor]
MRRKSTRINPQDAAAATSHSTSANFPPADTATDQTSTTTNPKKRKSVAFEQHLELAGDDNQSPSHPSNARTTRSRRSSLGTASTGTSANTTSQSQAQPSVKALGKRRAVSPTPASSESPAPPALAADSSASPVKRRKLSHSTVNPKLGAPTDKDYNLRSRPSRFAASDAASPSAASSTLLTKKTRSSALQKVVAPDLTSANTSSPSMPRKGTRASRAAKAKARAMEDEEDAVFEAQQKARTAKFGGHESGDEEDQDNFDEEEDEDEDEDEDVEMGDVSVSSSMRKRGGAKKEVKDKKEKEKEKEAIGEEAKTKDEVALSSELSAGRAMLSESEDDPDEPDSDHGSDNSDEDDDEDHDDEDDEDLEEFETSLGLHGEEREYQSGAEDDMHDAPQTYNDAGDPLSSSDHQAALDEADALFGALAGAGGSALGGPGGLGGAFQALRGMMSGMSGRLKGLLTALRDKEGDATAKLMALQELAELLSISTEDTLAGYFQIEAFSKELVAIVRGDSNGMGGGAGGGGGGGMTAEEAIAFGLDPNEVCGGGGGDTEENDVQMMLLACRCLANLMEALPGSAHSIVYAGAVPVLCRKLEDIQWIELAEQTLSTLEKISEEVPHAIVREGGLSALLTYLDFFSFHVQRTAVTAAANCCRSLSLDSFTMVKDAMPIFTNILGYPDQRVVEQGCLAIVRIVDSYRHYPDKLEQLLAPGLLTAIKVLLNPDSTTVGSSTYTQCLKALTTAAKASPTVAINLVELNIAHTLYHLLTGVAPPEWKSDEGRQVLERETTAEDDMLVMQNLVQRPKEQVQETLNLVCELLPPLPKDGIFDSRAFTGKGRPSSKNKVKKEEAPLPSSIKREEQTPELGSSVAAVEISSSTSTDFAPEVKMEGLDDVPIPSTSTSGAIAPVLSRASSSHRSSRSIKPRDLNKEALLEKRLELVSTAAPSGRQLVVKRYFALLLPTLVDVYAASVSPQVRTKAVLGLLKMVQFCGKDALADILHNVPFAAFIAAILSSHDQTTLITNALQLIELLLVKMPDAYQYTFRREGVMHEVEKLASAELVSLPSNSRLKKSSPSETPLAGDEAGPSGLTRALQGASVSTAATLTPAERQAQDAITLRARSLRDQYGASDSEPAVRAQEMLQRITGLVRSLDAFAHSTERAAKVEKDARTVVDEVAELFADEKNPLSSFEMLESGLVDGLLKFATATGEGSLSPQRRQEVLANAFMPQLDGKAASPAFATLVKRLQESLSRMEEFEVIVAAQNANEADASRSGTTMLGRQLKLRLIAEEGSDVPRSCSNIVVSIHAIATFQAFNDYLRPRILAAVSQADRMSTSLPSGSGGGTLSSLLAAFAAAAAANNRSSSSSPPPTEPTTSTSNAAASTSKGHPSSPPKEPKRRRSSRLSGKGVEPPEESVAPEDGAMDEDRCEDEEDEEEDRELFAGAFEPSPPSRDERPVHLEVNDDGGGGSKLVAKTPDGTRVATPTIGQAATSSTSSRLSPAPTPKTRSSYAAALKAEPTDFHLEFSMGGRAVDLDTTIFGAVHRHENQQPATLRRNMWHNIYDVRFRKVAGKARPDEDDAKALEARRRREGSIFSNMPASVPAGSQQAKILQLLHVLRNVSADYGESGLGTGVGLADTAFVNSKLTAKLNRQLEEPMIVASACLPDWAVDLAQSFPFLFPFDTRYTFLQSTSFGYARLMQKWIGQTRSDTSRRDENLGFLGRLQRQKVFELYGSSRASLEVEFFNEVGSGLGPTLEFYALVSKEFARKSLSLWRVGDHTDTNEFVHTATGLFPLPLDDSTTEAGKKALKVFRVLGQFVAKSMMDSRIIDVNFSRTFMRFVLEQDVPLTIASVRLVDPDLGKSLAHLQEYVSAKEMIEADESKTDEERQAACDAIEVRGATVSALTLDFTLPGYDIELKEGGKDIAVDINNLEEYISLVIEWTLSRGVEAQISEFKKGFSAGASRFASSFCFIVLRCCCAVFPVSDLQTFTAAELVLLTAAVEEDWTIEALTNASKADHGFTMESRTVKDFLSIMSELTLEERRDFLSFMTGSPRLPIGGFAALNPPLTIVRKDGGDAMLPSVMTCVNFVKLPDYSTREVVKSRMLVAVREGAAGFHLIYPGRFSVRMSANRAWRNLCRGA